MYEREGGGREREKEAPSVDGPRLIQVIPKDGGRVTPSDLYGLAYRRLSCGYWELEEWRNPMNVGGLFGLQKAHQEWDSRGDPGVGEGG